MSIYMFKNTKHGPPERRQVNNRLDLHRLNICEMEWVYAVYMGCYLNVPVYS